MRHDHAIDMTTNEYHPYLVSHDHAMQCLLSHDHAIDMTTSQFHPYLVGDDRANLLSTES